MDEVSIQETLQKGIRAARRGHTEPAQKLLIQVVRADPTREEAWLWLARVVEEPAQRAECLKRALALNPDNRWAAEQLEALQAPPAEEAAPAADETAVAEKAAPPRPPEPAPELELKILKCPKCGASVEPGDDAIQTLVCEHCGSVLNLTDEEARAVGKSPRRAKPSLPIKPGMEGTFDGKRCQVMGWIRYHGWDDEDHWYWDEWVLVTSQGKYLWLSYDEEAGFVLQHKIPLSPGANPKRFRISGIPVPDGRAYVVEEGPARILALAGELPWRAKVGETTHYYDARRGEKRYTLERSETELELYEGTVLSDSQVWQAFGRQDLIKKAKQAQKIGKRYRRLGYFCLILACLAIFLACGVGTVSGRTLAEARFVLTHANPMQAIPLEVKHPKRPYRISLETFNLPINSWAVVDVSMSDPEDNEFYLFSEEFWDEEGRDSEGYWHEKDVTGKQLIRPDTRGTYELYVEASEASVSSVDVRVKVVGPVWVSGYFIAFTSLSGFLGFFFLASASGASKLRYRGS